MGAVVKSHEVPLEETMASFGDCPEYEAATNLPLP